jgi:tRNA threonylcarbamoyladenosine biosynthesis protein TsaE
VAAAVACRSRSPEETRAIGEAIGTLFRPGDVVTLTGDLGAGKTCFVQGAARSLGVTTRVTSPSFILMREYDGIIPVIHIDVYRLDNVQELLDLGFEELLEPSHVIFVEWGDAVRRVLPESFLEVEIRMDDSDEEGRTIGMHPIGRAWSDRASEIGRLTAPWQGAA